jgi:hypothetical protein
MGCPEGNAIRPRLGNTTVTRNTSGKQSREGKREKEK